MDKDSVSDLREDSIISYDVAVDFPLSETLEFKSADEDMDVDSSPNVVATDSSDVASVSADVKSDASVVAAVNSIIP